MTQSGTDVRLVAPISGVLVPLEEVPDPVFAQRMLGDGVSIDPLSNELVAPCDGTVTTIHRHRHAVALTTSDGLELLLHVGLDTVGLEGEGFEAHVEQGDEVRSGQLLVSFEADFVADRVPSLLTLLVVTNGDRVASMSGRTGIVVEGRDTVLDVVLAADAGAPSSAGEPDHLAAADDTRPADVATDEHQRTAEHEETEQVDGTVAAEAQAVGPMPGDPVPGAVLHAPDTAPSGPVVAATDEPPGEAHRDTPRPGEVRSEPIVIANPTGLHARPAAVLVNAAKRYEASITIHHEGESADLKSIMMLLALGVRKGAEVHLTATGPDARSAVDDLTAQLRSGLGEGTGDEADATGSADAGRDGAEGLPVLSTRAAGESSGAERSVPAEPGDSASRYRGVPASSGLAVGPIAHVARVDFDISEYVGLPDDERRTLESALDRAAADLAALREELAGEPGDERSAIFGVHEELVRDPALTATAFDLVAEGKSAGWAWRESFSRQADRLAAVDDDVLAGRATDVRDVGARVLAEITGQRTDAVELPDGAILVAEDLTPSDTASLDRTKVAGFVTVHGGASSHVAIIARALDLPAVAGVDARVLELEAGTQVVLDGTEGTLRTDVSDDELQRVLAVQQQQAARRDRDLAAATEEAITADGHRLEVVANIGSLDEARAAGTQGADGVGLLRSEFVFLGRSSAPDEDEQAQVYTEIADAFAPGQPLVIRTLDVGGDKPLSYLPMPHEDNPFLGERGLRAGLARPEILRTQVRAILRASSAAARVHIMFPMVATLDELRQAKAIVEEERQSLGVAPIPVGIMVEVPAVAAMAPQFAAEVDFFSIGTNDLTQYTLAMDRGHSRLAAQVDGLNPAVLALVAQAVEAAHAAGRWVGVCGGLASDPQAVPVLVGLGVDELSAPVPAVPAVKAQVRGLTRERCEQVARAALAADTAAAVRALVPLEEV